MERFVKGDVVVLPFPFTDLSGSKKRPSLVIASLLGDDVILCQITSKDKNDSYSIELLDNSFEKGNLPIQSFIRPNRIFTADKNIIVEKRGHLKNNAIIKVEEKIIEIIRQ